MTTTSHLGKCPTCGGETAILTPNPSGDGPEAAHLRAMTYRGLLAELGRDGYVYTLVITDGRVIGCDGTVTRDVMPGLLLQLLEEATGVEFPPTGPQH